MPHRKKYSSSFDQLYHEFTNGYVGDLKTSPVIQKIKLLILVLFAIPFASIVFVIGVALFAVIVCLSLTVIFYLLMVVVAVGSIILTYILELVGILPL